MTTSLHPIILGAVAMASVIAALFFLKFWRQSGDRLFIWFAIAFAIDAVTRLLLALTDVSSEQEPFFYLARLTTFCAIIFAVVQKNWR